MFLLDTKRIFTTEYILGEVFISLILTLCFYEGGGPFFNLFKSGNLIENS